MLTSPLRGTVAACLTVLVALCVAGTAQASSFVLVNEPAYTKGTSNSWYTTTSHATGDNYYYLCFSTYDNNVAMPGEMSNGSNGPGTTNCQSNTPKGNQDMGWTVNAANQPGHSYKMCVSDYVDWPLDGGTWWNNQSTSCASTILDNSKPVIATGINGDQEYTKDPSVAVRIDYNDSISPPWNGADGRAANVVCFSQGAACTPSNYDPNCSVPAAWNRVTSFVCGATLPSDGKWYACARSSDRAIPDMRDWGGVNSSQANVSDTACGWITLDRQGPTVTVDAGSATVKVGQLVTLSAQASDAVSGVAGGIAWTFGDNTGGATGATATHTYTQPGTYVVAATGTDGAGNPGTGTKTITVAPADTPAGGGGGGTPTPTPTPTPTGGGGTTTTTVIKEIVKETGGPTQATTLGALDVTTAKTVKLSRTLRKLPLALTAEAPGTVQVALLKGATIVAKGATKLSGAGTFAYRLKLPKASRLKAGAYKLKVSFTPAGQAKALTRTLKIKLVGAKAARAASVTTHPLHR